jgi:Mg2+ and Co2+ transporter CorA
MMAIVGAFAAIVAATIGFALWDRRTMIRPFEDKVKKIEDDILEDKKRLKDLLAAVKEYAKKDQGLADILKSFSLL